MGTIGIFIKFKGCTILCAAKGYNELGPNLIYKHFELNSAEQQSIRGKKMRELSFVFSLHLRELRIFS